MAEAIRYRPVLMGEPPDDGQVFFIAENPDGSLYFRDTSWPWSVEGTLESVTVADLPEFYARFRDVTRILPIREAAGDEREDAYDVLLQQIEALAEGREEPARAVRPAA
jgi:hypothetical protein